MKSATRFERVWVPVVNAAVVYTVAFECFYLFVSQCPLNNKFLSKNKEWRHWNVINRSVNVVLQKAIIANTGSGTEFRSCTTPLFRIFCDVSTSELGQEVVIRHVGSIEEHPNEFTWELLSSDSGLWRLKKLKFAVTELCCYCNGMMSGRRTYCLMTLFYHYNVNSLWKINTYV